MHAEGEGPFLVSDLQGCNDITDTVGVHRKYVLSPLLYLSFRSDGGAAPVIDSSTDTAYFWAKGYLGNGQSGTGYQTGAYRFHAVDVVTLKERPGFPILLDGHHADNDPARYFNGGIHLQRPALNLVNGVVYAGFGSHCDQYNFTGWLVGMRASDGAVVTAYSTYVGSLAPEPDDTFTGGGGGAGVWMGGDSITSDEAGRVYFATGNAMKNTVNGPAPASGRLPINTPSESIIRMDLDANGVATMGDYFQTYAYQSLDAADRDLGGSGVALLPFTGPGINHMAITCGKNGQCYVTNADNLGGYAMGPGGEVRSSPLFFQAFHTFSPPQMGISEI